jgi:hypothetical protein
VPNFDDGIFTPDADEWCTNHARTFETKPKLTDTSTVNAQAARVMRCSSAAAMN